MFQVCSMWCFSVTPLDYEPPGFKSTPSEEDFQFKEEPVNIKVGDVATVSHLLYRVSVSVFVLYSCWLTTHVDSHFLWNTHSLSLSSGIPQVCYCYSSLVLNISIPDCEWGFCTYHAILFSHRSVKLRICTDSKQFDTVEYKETADATSHPSSQKKDPSQDKDKDVVHKSTEKSKTCHKRSNTMETQLEEETTSKICLLQ